MRLSILVSSVTVGAALLLSGGAARAAHGHGHAEEEESEYPLSYVERPMTLPKLTLAPELDFDAGRVGLFGAGTAVVGMNLGASFGITKDLEVGAFFLPLEFKPEVGYGSVATYTGNLQLFATYRFLHQKGIELGARLRTYIVTADGAGAVIEPSVPLLVHLGTRARLDAEVGVPIIVSGNGTTEGAKASYIGIDVPVAFSVDIVEPFHVGVRSGVNILDLGHPKEFATIPLGVFFGYAVGGKKPILDIDPYFTWTQFLQPGGGLGDERIHADVFSAGLELRGYFYF